MKIIKDIAHIVLGIWLLLTGIQALFSISSPVLRQVMPVLAVTAAVLLFIGLIRLNREAGGIALAVWLLLRGLDYLTDLSVPYFGVIMGILALIAGILIIAGK